MSQSSMETRLAFLANMSPEQVEVFNFPYKHQMSVYPYLGDPETELGVWDADVTVNGDKIMIHGYMFPCGGGDKALFTISTADGSVTEMSTTKESPNKDRYKQQYDEWYAAAKDFQFAEILVEFEKGYNQNNALGSEFYEMFRVY